jgi:hypothetical protein
MMDRVKKEDIARLMHQLRRASKTPLDRFEGAPAVGRPHNVGYLKAEYSAIYGGWRLVQINNTMGAEQDGPLGFPRERVSTRCFYHMINVAIEILSH